MKYLIVAVVCFVLSCHASDKATERPCNLAFKCSLVDDPAWVTDGKKCLAFRNSCILANENCNRQNRYVPVLENIEKADCQALCKPICPRMMKPVCGYYNDIKREFSNQCMMNYHICSTGQTFMTYNEGKCEEPMKIE